MFVIVLGINTLFQVLWFGVSEVSRFKCPLGGALVIKGVSGYFG